ncbi:MAG: hypothetical protein A2283_12495 [Lentisphaerae bacterium RIFOXYA12_FULL_48_11]|nr:MAG: hypothetical protein A2283_12495 [Lentisphaerae bacterium RIFOXYA12_FULL_48_11]
MDSMKSSIGLGATQPVVSSLTLGVRPLQRAVTSSPLVPPANVTPPGNPAKAVQAVIASGQLAMEYNGVLVSFLGNEAKRWMGEVERKAALDQAVSALKAKIDISKGEQVETGLGTAVALAMQLAGGDVVGKAGASVAGDYYSEMSDWINAAYDLAALGYKEEAGRFFEHGMKHFPYEEHRGRCVAGYAMAHADKAFAFLVSKLKGPAQAEIQSAIRMLGHLASSSTLDADTRTKCMDIISGYAVGMMNAAYYLDAIYALDVSNDPRAVPVLKKFMKGMMVTDEQQRPALTSLALRYKDAESLVVLKSIINTGVMGTYDWRDKQFAYEVLVRAGDDAGYAYAQANLSQRAKGFMAATDQPDLKPAIIDVLVRYGDQRGVKAILPSYDKYGDEEWMKTWSATAMMLLGEGCAKGLAARNINTPGWEFTAVSIAQGLAMYGDYSGFDTLQRLVSLRQVSEGVGFQIARALAGRQSEVKAARERLVRLRMKIAATLGQMDNARSVPLLEVLLGDESDEVRRSAAIALTELSVPEAIPAMVKALDISYGIIPGQRLDTTPVVHARLVRAAGNRWGKDLKVGPLLDKALTSGDISVQMLGAAMKQ